MNFKIIENSIAQSSNCSKVEQLKRKSLGKTKWGGIPTQSKAK